MNKKALVITILAIIILLAGVFGIVKLISGNNKNYELEKISEKDYKYFTVLTDGKCGVIDLNR